MIQKYRALSLVPFLACFCIGFCGLGFCESAKKKIDYEELRSYAFTADPGAQPSITYTPKNKIYGVIFDWGVPDGVTTLVTFTSGDASLYFSTGGGIIGGAGQESVKSAAVRFCNLADDYFKHFKKTASYPLPETNTLTLYVLTKKGVYTATVAMEDLQKGNEVLEPLFAAGNAVITEFRLLDEKRKRLEDE